MTSQCGAFLDRCVCRRTPTVARDATEMQARHEAAVARARRSGWAASATRRATKRRGTVLPPLTVEQRRAALDRKPEPTPDIAPPPAPVLADPTGRGWRPMADIIRDIEAGAA